jgi:hypothetical protein
VREYFQHEIERTKKATYEQNKERLRKEAVAAEGNYPNAEDDEEAQLQRAIHLSRAEELYHQGVEQRGGAYEHGGGSGSTRENPLQRMLRRSRGSGSTWENPLQRMLRRSGSRRDSPVVVEDYNLAAGGRRGMTQPRIDTGSWTQKGKNAKEAIGKAWSKFFYIAGVPGRQTDNPYFVSAVRETRKWGNVSFIGITHKLCDYISVTNLLISIWLQVKVSRH